MQNSYSGGAFKIAVKEKFYATTAEAGIPALQSRFDSPTTENLTVSGVPIIGAFRAEKKTGESILNPQNLACL